MQTYLWVNFHVKHKKLPFLAVLTWFLILGKIQDGSQDGDHCWWRNRPPAAPPFIKYTSFLLRRSKAFQWRQNRFEILQPIKNSGEGFHLPSSCTILGGWFCVCVRGLSWQGSGWFCMRLHFFIKASFIIDTKGLYCVTKGNISFSSLLFCFRSAAFLLWVLLLIAIFLSKLCGQPLSINRFLKSEILPQRSLFVGCSRLLACQIHFNDWWVVKGENV